MDPKSPASPSSLAAEAFSEFKPSLFRVEPHVEWGCLEHFKQVAREVLTRDYEPNAEEPDPEQGEFWSGHFQARYSKKRTRGEEPVFVSFELLTVEDKRWNAERFRKAGRALIAHGNALDASADEQEREAA